MEDFFLNAVKCFLFLNPPARPCTCSDSLRFHNFSLRGMHIVRAQVVSSEDEYSRIVNASPKTTIQIA